MNATRKDALGLLGIGAACIACCAGPILAFLGGLGVASLVSTAFIGAVGFAIAAIAIVAALVILRRRSRCTPSSSETLLIPVAIRPPSDPSRSAQ